MKMCNFPFLMANGMNVLIILFLNTTSSDLGISFRAVDSAHLSILPSTYI